MEGEVYSTSTPPEAEAVKDPRKTKNKNRKRFNEEQIRSLESIFELETKLEPRRKLQLARELGLQPRQVAIWFQNRRARWRSKEIEQSYRELKASYDSLYSQFECLKEENQSLLTQLQDLNDLLEKGHDQSSKSRDLCGNSGSDSGDTKWNHETKPSCSNECPGRAVAYSDEERSADQFFQQEKAEFLNMIGQADGSLQRLHEKGCNLDSDGLNFDQSCGSSNWWDFWTWKNAPHSPE